MLLLQQQFHLKALESAEEVLQILPESKHAAALLATSQHKAGRKKQAAVTISELCVAFQRTDDATMNEELGCATTSHMPPLHVQMCSPFSFPHHPTRTERTDTTH